MDSTLDSQEALAIIKWHIQEKRLDKALVSIKYLLQQSTVEDEAVLIGARLYAQLQLFSHSEKLFTDYLKRNSSDINAIFQLGMTQFDSGKNEKALETWKSILSKAKNHPPALFYSAVGELQIGNKENATSHLKILIDTCKIDNLYYEKAKDLLAKLNQSSEANDISATDFKTAYQTEH